MRRGDGGKPDHDDGEPGDEREIDADREARARTTTTMPARSCRGVEQAGLRGAHRAEALLGVGALLVIEDVVREVRANLQNMAPTERGERGTGPEPGVRGAARPSRPTRATPRPSASRDGTRAPRRAPTPASRVVIAPLTSGSGARQRRGPPLRALEDDVVPCASDDHQDAHGDRVAHLPGDDHEFCVVLTDHESGRNAHESRARPSTKASPRGRRTSSDFTSPAASCASRSARCAARTARRAGLRREERQACQASTNAATPCDWSSSHQTSSATRRSSAPGRGRGPAARRPASRSRRAPDGGRAGPARRDRRASIRDVPPRRRAREAARQAIHFASKCSPIAGDVAAWPSRAGASTIAEASRSARQHVGAGLWPSGLAGEPMKQRDGSRHRAASRATATRRFDGEPRRDPDCSRAPWGGTVDLDDRGAAPRESPASERRRAGALWSPGRRS